MMHAFVLLSCLLLALPPQETPPAKAAPAAKPAAATPAAKPAPETPAGKPAPVTPAGRPAAAADDPVAPTEKALLAEFAKASSPSDAAARTAAVAALGDGSRMLLDGGSSKAVAKALGKGLLDENLEVRAAAISQLDWGRHVDTTIEMLGAGMEDLLSQVDKRLTRPDEESRLYVSRGTRLIGDGAAALANYRDDRSVEALVTLLRSLDKNTTNGNNLSTHAVGPLATAVLTLGTHDAVEAAIKQTQTYVGAGGRQEAAALILHKALSEFAVKFGQAPPEYSENVSVEWNKWWEKAGDKLPKSLGHLKDPPTSPPPRDMKRMKDRKDDGSAPRQ